MSNCQELYFLEDDDVPILQTDASDYGIGGMLYTVRNGKVHVIRFFSKALTGAQLNWHTREKECYGIFYGVKLFEAELDGRYFILRTDHKNSHTSMLRSSVRFFPGSFIFNIRT